MDRDTDTSMSLLSENGSYRALHKQHADDASDRDEVDSQLDKMTTMRLLSIFALAFTNTGAQIHDFFLGPGSAFMAADLHLGSERSWIPIANSLAGACVALTVGYLQDLLGRKVPMAVGFVLMIAGITVIATSDSFAQSVAGSAITGVAGSLQELGSVAAIAEMVPARQRGAFLALNTTLTLLFTPSLLYAELLGASGWRWLFWAALIWNVIALLLMSITYFPTKITRENRPTGSVRVRDFDFVGAILLVVGLTLFLVALQSGGSKHPWNSAYVLAQLVVGLVLIILFVVWESREYGRPLMPFRLFRGQRLVGLSLLVGSMGSVCYLSVLNLGPDIINAVFSFSPIGYGVISLGPGISLAVGAIGFNVLLTVLHGHARELVTVAAVMMTAFVGAQAVINPNGSTTFAILGSFASLGIGGTLVPVETLVTLACPEDLISTAVALSSSVRTLAGTVGYAILYNVFTSKTESAVPGQMGPRVIAAGLPRNETAVYIAQFVQSMNLNTPPPPSSAAVQEAAREGFQWATAYGAQWAFYVSIPFGVMAILCAMALPDTRPYMTNRVLAKSR